ncbi:MAG TPA: fatty acid desaturase [Acidimicrobiia bacterium]|nr:fatty acid desaturase [Acidimicrobiia bacterium]
MTAPTISPPRVTGVTERSTGTLLPVLRAIPERCYDRPAWKGVASIARGVALYGAVLVALAAADAWWLLVPLWVLAGAAVSGLFVLGHDAAHGALFESKQTNRIVGRALMVPSLHIYEAWVLGHNRIHHGHTLREGMDFVWHPLTVEAYRDLSGWQRARHRVEWSFLGAGLYYLREVWWNKMITFTAPERYRAGIRRDTRFLVTASALLVGALALVGWFVDGGATGALWFVTKLFVVPFLSFTWWIGFTVYVHHIARDVKWWPRRSWNSFHGQVEGTTVLRVPWILNLFFCNIFVHVPHHVDVRIPWYSLPAAADAIAAAFPDAVVERRLRARDYVAETRACKLYDFTAQRWLPYAAARRSGAITE